MKKRRKGVHFTPFFQNVAYSKEWMALSVSAMIVYLYIKLGYNSANNGNITLPYSRLKFLSSATFSRAIKELIDNGWIEKTKPGGLYRSKSEYRITERYDRLFKS